MKKLFSWSRNLREVGEGTLDHKGETFAFRGVELFGDERAAIVAEYKRQLGKIVANYFRQLPNPDDHPTFRVERIDG